MSSIVYDDIFSSFLSNIADYKIATQDEDITIEQLNEYLHKAIGTPYIRALFITVNLNDDESVLTYEMKNPDVNGDDDFMINMLGKAMVYEWVHPQVRKTSLLAQMFSGKEVKWYAQSNHMSELRGIEEDTELEVRRMIRDRGFISNKYLEGGNT
jgi:hypothetical protein